MTSPKNATTTGGSRYYDWRGQRFFSVTTILSGGIPKPALIHWAANEVAGYVCDNHAEVAPLIESDRDAAYDLLKRAPWRKRDKAAALGSDVHAAVEAHALGRPMPPWGPLVKPRMDAFVRFLDEYQPVYELAEASVFSRTEMYAGTLDAIVTLPTLGGRRILLDVKTGGKAVYPESAVQLAAYRYAEFVGLADGSEAPMPEVDGCAVLHIPDEAVYEKGYDLVEVQADREIFKTFVFAREIYRWQNVTSKTVILGSVDSQAVPFGMLPLDVLV